MFSTYPQHRDQLNETASTYIFYVSLTIGFIVTLFAVFNFFGVTRDTQPQVMLHDSVLAMAAFATAWLQVRKKIPSRLAHPVMTLLMLTLASSTFHSMYLDPRPVFTIHFLIFYLVVGNIFLSIPWALVTFITTLIAWFVIGAHRLSPSEFIDYSLAIVTAILASFMLLQVRICRTIKLITLHHKDKEAREKLAQSIEDTKREIIERQKAEFEQNRLENQLRQAQKLEAVGRLAGGVAHDINNMLAVISGTTESLLQDHTAISQEIAEDLESVLAACNRGKNLTSNLLGFAQKGKYRREQIDVNQLIRDVKTFMSRSIPDHIWFETFLSQELPCIEGDPGQINQVLVNLINNAVDAMERDGHLVITTERVDEIERQGVSGLESIRGKFIKVIVSDTGRGMKEGTIERAFEPFFSTKKMGEGTGLGLSMVYGTITNHGGAVLIRSAIDQGTSVTIYLPEYTRNTLRMAKDSHPTRISGVQQGTVLLVDDEPLVRSSGRRILSQMGFDVIEASNGEEAIGKYTNQHYQFDVVLLDLIMPGMEGDEVFRRLKALDQNVKVIFVSAYSRDTVRVDNLLAEGAIDFIQKPFSISEINMAITTAVEIPQVPPPASLQ